MKKYAIKIMSLKFYSTVVVVGGAFFLPSWFFSFFSCSCLNGSYRMHTRTETT